MKIELRSAELILKANQPLSLRAATNTRITCTEGIIWITVGGVVSDIFLAPGQVYRVPSNALTLIESIGEGKIHLEKMRPATWLERCAAICAFTVKQWTQGKPKGIPIQTGWDEAFRNRLLSKVS